MAKLTDSRSGSHRLPMTGFVVLGLVGVRPRAGYELALFADRSIAHMWPIAKSQVYSELNRLESLGLVTGADVVQERLPDKRVYSITDAGADALRDWIHDDDFDERFHSSFLTKLFFAKHADPLEIDGLISTHEERTKRKCAALQEVADHLKDRRDAFFPRMTALYGIRQAEAVLNWIEEIRPLIKEIS